MIETKFSGILVILLSAVLLSSCFFGVLEPAGAATISSLHVLGDKILDSANRPVILRGIGRTGDMESASGMWSTAGDVNVAAWGQKWMPIEYNIPLMDATFECYQQVWNVNMIRLFVLPSWYWQDDIVPSQQDPANYPLWTTPISYRAYIQTVVAEAQKYGIYVDLVPFQLISGYQDGNQGGAQGLPLSGWDSVAQGFLRSTNLSERQFWQWFWTMLSANLRSYPNVIYEAYNEPENLGNDAITPAYLEYLTLMYTAVRSTGSSNLIFMQWNGGYVPTWNDLSWCTQITTAIPRASNIAFTTHVYRHAPYFNSQWGVDYPTVLIQMLTAIKSMGVVAPLVINEAGSCMSYVAANDVQNELNWWSGLNRVAQTLSIGLSAYYWMADTDLGPVFAGEALLSGPWPARAATPPANNMGQIFLNYGIDTRLLSPRLPPLPSLPPISPTPNNENTTPTSPLLPSTIPSPS